MKALLTIHILAGGTSRRMGTDKSHLSINEVPLLQWCHETAESLGVPVVHIIKDIRTAQGPLAGIETGLTQSKTSLNLFMSCDMPLVSSDTLRDLVEQAKRTQGVVCMEMDDRRGFPMVVPQSFLSRVKSELDAGHRSLYALFHHIDTHAFTWNELDRMEAYNVNTPEEFDAVRAWIKAHRLHPPILDRRRSLIQVHPPQSDRIQ